MVTFSRLRFASLLALPLFATVGCSSSDDGGAGATDASSENASELPPRPADTETVKNCDVVIAGGTTAALAAALTSADRGAKTCLLEPTEWLGGQLTATGVPAIDLAWHTTPSGLKVGDIAKDPANLSGWFRKMFLGTHDTSRCTVSFECFQPKDLLLGPIANLTAPYRNNGRLVIFPQTVVKRFEVAGGRATKLVAVKRQAKAGVEWGGYDKLPSQDVPDWYDVAPSARYDKTVLEFPSDPGRPAVFIDATDWGELLALSGAPYLQGVEVEEGSLADDDRCGQATVFPFAMKMEAGPTREDFDIPAADAPSQAFYSLTTGSVEENNLRTFDFSEVWRYRRLRGESPQPSAGDISNQNWNPGNDYPFGYLFKSKADAAAERGDWRGGVDFGVMAGAERHAYGWHTFFKQQAGGRAGNIKLDRGVFGTGHGLSKLPYIRDTRRSVGLGGFIVTANDITGAAGAKTGTAFPDRVGLGAYAVDVHGLRNGCSYPAFIDRFSAAHDTLPYFIPFRALTNQGVDNLLVAGKTMAQSFVVNAATRLHPIEWSSGSAAGVAAAHMARFSISSQLALDSVADIQAQAALYSPIRWKVNGQMVP
jgi:hypothetical protein